jgi:hypothetical protein
MWAPHKTARCPRSGKLFRHRRKSTAKIDPPPETVVLKKHFAGVLCSFRYCRSLKVHMIKLKVVINHYSDKCCVFVSYNMCPYLSIRKVEEDTAIPYMCTISDLRRRLRATRASGQVKIGNEEGVVLAPHSGADMRVPWTQDRRGDLFCTTTG